MARHRLIPLAQAAARLGVSYRYLWKLIARGELRVHPWPADADDRRRKYGITHQQLTAIQKRRSS